MEGRRIGFWCRRCGCEFEVSLARLELAEPLKCPNCLLEFRGLERLAQHLAGLEEVLRENPKFPFKVQFP